MAENDTISAVDFESRRGQLRLIDVRARRDFISTGHVPGSESVPATDLDSLTKNWNQFERLVVVGSSESQAVEMAGSLKAKGFVSVQCLDGGLEGWSSAGLSLCQNEHEEVRSAVRCDNP